MAQRVTDFKGMIPRTAARLLPRGFARVAANASVKPGELRPLRQPALVHSVTNGDAALSMFHLDDGTWLTWNRAGVNMVRGQLKGTVRYPYSGDGPPKITSAALAVPQAANGNPAAARSLGIPTPGVAPTLGASGGASANVETRFYVYTFISDWFEESAPSPVSGVVTGKIDATWAVTGMDAAPLNTGIITGAVHSAGIVTVTTSERHYLRATDALTIAGVTGMTDLNGIWTVLDVPSPTTFRVTLATAQAYTAAGTWTRTYPWGTCTKRIYRTAGTSADFQLVADGVTGTSYNDTLLTAAIPGDDLISADYLPPDVNLVGFTSMGNGIIAAWDGANAIWFCEPFQYHAWPPRYKRELQDAIVGIAAWDTNLLAATNGLPVVLSGYDPAQMSITRHVKPFPCVSRYSVCGIGDGAVFATKDGLVRADVAGSSLFTNPYFAPDDWNKLTPAAMRCAYDGSRLFITDDTNRRLYMLDTVDDSGLTLTYQLLQAVFIDTTSGYLYLGYGKNIYEFDSFAGAPASVDWWSQEFVTAKPVNLGAARVEVDPDFAVEAQAAIAAARDAVIDANQALLASGGARGSINAAYVNRIPINDSLLAALPDDQLFVSLSFYAGGKLRLSKTILKSDVFRLPSGYKADTWSVRVQGTHQVKAITVGATPQDLENA